MKTCASFAVTPGNPGILSFGPFPRGSRLKALFVSTRGDVPEIGFPGYGVTGTIDPVTGVLTGVVISPSDVSAGPDDNFLCMAVALSVRAIGVGVADDIAEFDASEQLVGRASSDSIVTVPAELKLLHGFQSSIPFSRDLQQNQYVNIKVVPRTGFASSWHGFAAVDMELPPSPVPTVGQ